MREILFRGKRVDNGEWVCGYYVYDDSGQLTEKPRADIIRLHEHPCGFSMIPFEVMPESVSEFTGLTDKNGNKIFEGDYIVCRQAIEGNFIDEHIEMGYVEMKHGAFGLHRKQGYYRPFKDWLEDYEYEVLGNIHDNPELLKGETNA